MHKVVITVFLVICVIAATFAARLGHGSGFFRQLGLIDCPHAEADSEKTVPAGTAARRV